MNQSTCHRILLIDDTPSIHEDFRKILLAPMAATDPDPDEAALFGHPASLPNGGYELDSAYQGDEGIAKVEVSLKQGRPYAMAFVDMRMPPGWDGVETVERLWRIDSQVQIVICTAYSDHSWDEVLARLDLPDRLIVLKKPFDVIEVQQLARTLTIRRELTRRSTDQMNTLAHAVHDLQASEAVLRSANQELEAFAQAMSHDLRSPLGVVKSFSGLLAKELTDHASARASHFLSRIQANAEMGEQLIEGLLFLNQISRAELCIDSIDISMMSIHLLDTFRCEGTAHRVRTTVQSGLQARGDMRLIQIALRQLLHNAWKFTSRETDAQIEVGQQAGKDGEKVFYVRDNGIGFDVTYADQLFHTCHRLSAADEFPGAGVGLVTVDRIIGRHGGRVWAESRLGEGATFYFTIPSSPAQPLP